MWPESSQIHRRYEEDTVIAREVTPEVTPEVGKMLSVMQGELSRSEIQQELALTDEEHFRRHCQ